MTGLRGVLPWSALTHSGNGRTRTCNLPGFSGTLYLLSYIAVAVGVTTAVTADAALSAGLGWHPLHSLPEWPADMLCTCRPRNGHERRWLLVAGRAV